MFVKALKEHDEALQVVKLLREDVAGVIREHGGNVDFAQFKDVTDKLAAYTHLFNEEAMRAFAELTGDDHAAHAVDAETGEYDNRAKDNQKGALELESGPSGTDDRDLG
jgi:quinol monooxygenase YgiN